ncbi:MAG: hypothetical protein ACD_62C00121G0002 [uncultured bacterium]|nr:MAG: hypothetical protein ACD_62C00121G0002 [uncultured bacterium]
MKTLLVLCVLLSLMVIAPGVHAEGCYLCANNKYVSYRGDDSEGKRRSASECGCRVLGVMAPCEVSEKDVLCRLTAPGVKKTKAVSLEKIVEQKQNTELNDDKTNHNE